MINSFSVFADYKRVYDKVTQRSEEVCAIQSDGTMEVAVRCEGSSLDTSSTIYKRKSDEIINIITPKIDQTYPVGVYNNYIVYIHYGMENGQSLIQFIDPTESTEKKYSKGSYWLVDTTLIDMMIEKTNLFKVSDTFCLKRTHGKYSAGQAVTILGVFENNKSANVHFEKSFLERFFDFHINEPSHLIELSNLESCSNIPTLNPEKMINTSAPTSKTDIKINNQQTNKDVSNLQEISTEQKVSNDTPK